MKTAVIVFPGSNCDRDAAVAIEQAMGKPPVMVWHRETALPDVDLIVLPGGFSFGDYLRAGALAARSPIMGEVVARANAGVAVLGICNGFQILTESGLLPGAILRNAGLNFVCRTVPMRVENNRSKFTDQYELDEVVHIPVAHHDGNYFADDETLKELEDEGRVGFRYCSAEGAVDAESNINGSRNNIAGIYNKRGTILGMMPHPENHVEELHGCTDGRPLFDGLAEVLS